MQMRPPMPMMKPQVGAKCERGSRMLVIITFIVLAILLLVYATVVSFGWSLVWLLILLLSYMAGVAFTV